MEPYLTELAHNDAHIYSFTITTVADHDVIAMLFAYNIYFATTSGEIGS
jgi:hypothetical protein